MTVKKKPRTIRDLRKSGYQVLPIREELRRNLVKKLRNKETLFPKIVGFQDTVVPQLQNAILAGQDIVLLGERGQAKSRIIRSLTTLLDDEIPVIAGCEINDNPFAPVCRACRDKCHEMGDEVEIAWLQRDDRYGEKLATPDISIADLIGEADPIRVAEGRYLSDELTIHYGLIPRTNRGIFSINELPRPGGAHTGWPVQPHGGTGHTDQGLSHPAAAGHLHCGHRQSGGLHQPRPHHYASQRPVWLAHPYPLSQSH